jgi:hypothetical protein
MMTPVSYLISISGSQKGVEAILTVAKIAGRGQAFHSFSNGDVSTDLWIIPKGKRNRQEVLKQLQAIPAIHSVSVVALSNPIKEKELKEVRELFAGVGLDASSVTNEDLSLFINAKLQGQYTYYIDYDLRGKTPVKIQIKPIQEHPHFSPDWVKATDYTETEIPDRELTIDDIKISSVVIENIEMEEEPPPPPPPNDK